MTTRPDPPHDPFGDISPEGSASSCDRHLRREQAKVGKVLDLLRARGANGFVRAAHGLRGLAGYWALLERCQELRYDDPSQMIDLARLAALVSERLDPALYGERLVADFRCRAAIELGNAYRVADRLDEADKALGEAAELCLQGTGDVQLRARMCDIQASLLADRRRFEAACEALEAVREIHRRTGDSHLAGRALISQGLYTVYQGKPDEAIDLIRRGLQLIDGRRDPELLFVAIHNQARCLMEAGRFREARTLLWTNLQRHGESVGRVNSLKLRWLRAQIDCGLDELERAENGFLEVRRGFGEVGLAYTEALVNLELALLLARQGRTDESRTFALEAAEVFLSLGIRRELLAAVLVLRQALELRVESTALLDSTLDFLRQAEDDPTMSFENWIET
jgi:tetratricopeptide (TPR) repeat protein